MTYEPSKLKVVGTRPIRPDGFDKVTGRATFGADHTMPGMLWGRILRSPHAHARIKSINTEKALALPGVKAVVTGQDLPVPSGMTASGEVIVNISDLARNVLAHGKVLYDGHAVAAVAATSDKIARQALKLIEVDYEVLPFVQDVDEAMKPDAPLLHEDMITAGVEPKPEKPSNIARKWVIGLGDPEDGFTKADMVIERTYKTRLAHQGYIEPHACVANYGRDGQSVVWCSSQGQFVVRDLCVALLQIEAADLKVIPAEIGGGFGGKTTVYLEPVALMLSKIAHRPVKMTMTRSEVLRATGPTSGTSMDVKIGATKDGTITGATAELRFQAGAFPGSPVMAACMTAFAAYDLPNVGVVGYDVVTNGPKVAAYRAPGAPQAAYAVEMTVSELAEMLGMDQLAFRQKNAAREGTKAAYGATFGPIGMLDCIAVAKDHPHMKANLGPNQGRGVANGFWFNIGGQSVATVAVNPDGTVSVIEGNPDIGGTRAAMAMMAAEVLGIDYERVRPIVADTASIPHNDVTGGSRVTFATGLAVTKAAEAVVAELRKRAAKIWDVDVDAVVWENGAAHTASEDQPITLAELAQKAPRTGGPITGQVSINAQGAGPAFTTHICDVEVDRETGAVKILRYTTIQDAGRAIHPSYVEGQMQGGVVQGIGWALNEEYIYDSEGHLENPGFLDYRMPVASDLPMIDTVIVEVPNPNHPFGVRGVGEVPIVPPLAAIANAVYDAVGVRMTELPISPPRLLAALEAQPKPALAAE